MVRISETRGYAIGEARFDSSDAMPGAWWFDGEAGGENRDYDIVSKEQQ